MAAGQFDAVENEAEVLEVQGLGLKRDGLTLQVFRLSMILSGNPLRTFPDHAPTKRAPREAPNSCRRRPQFNRRSDRLFTNGGGGANAASASGDANGGANDGASASAPRWSAASHPFAPSSRHPD